MIQIQQSFFYTQNKYKIIFYNETNINDEKKKQIYFLMMKKYYEKEKF